MYLHELSSQHTIIIKPLQHTCTASVILKVSDLPRVAVCGFHMILRIYNDCFR